MSRAKSNKPKRNVWTDLSPYGTYEGEPGNPAEWASAFKEAWDARTAKDIVNDESPWDILGIVAGSTLAEVKTAFRKLMLVHHPDKGGDEETCKRIIAAYTILQEMLNK